VKGVADASAPGGLLQQAGEVEVSHVGEIRAHPAAGQIQAHGVICHQRNLKEKYKKIKIEEQNLLKMCNF
jgi:hypothetical protein